MRKIAVVTSSRADYGLLRPILFKLAKNKDCELELIVTGSHLSESHGYTIREIESDGFPIDHRIALNSSAVTRSVAAHQSSDLLLNLTRIFKAKKPELLVMLGDRYEIFIVAFVATLMRIPIAHIHGGELTSGSMDDVFRHAITKMSHLHFTALKEYGNRVVQMGEQPSRVYVVGGLGAENVDRLNLKTRAMLASELGIEFSKKNYLITMHPNTFDGSNEINSLFRVLDKLEESQLFFTLPNADPGSQELITQIKKYVKAHPNAQLLKSLGWSNYLSLAAVCDAVVGNSSSGLLEIPSLKVATINIGSRQKGRITGESVINCEAEPSEIMLAFEALTKKEFKEMIKNSNNPYFQHNTSEKIANTLMSVDLEGIMSKTFFNLNLEELIWDTK